MQPRKDIISGADTFDTVEGNIVRFADDAVMAFADLQDAKRVLDVLGKRLARYELTLHPDKTRFVDFRCKRPNGKDGPDKGGTTFTFLGFCHVWGKSRRGKTWCGR
ncbi:MAG TPA: reverse transcriptase domain-containing protein [Candidatus Solibacter sp.]|nr:reverse transcriptase domain-containing protein [Candidatus Solibacter sp.]